MLNHSNGKNAEAEATAKATQSAKTNGTTQEEAPTFHGGFNMGSTSTLAGGLAASMGFSTKSNGASKKIHDIFKEIISQSTPVTTNTVDTALYLSNEYDGASGLAFDTIAVIGRTAEHVVCKCFFIVQTRQAEYDSSPYTTTDGTVVNISKFPSDAHDDTFVSMMTSAMVDRYGVAAANVVILNTKVLYKTFNIEDSEREFILALNDVGYVMHYNILQDMSELTLQAISTDIHGGLAVNIRKVQPSENIVDENGNSISPNLACTVNCVLNSNIQAKDTMNRANTTIHIGDAFVRTTVVYTGDAAGVSNAFNANGVLPVETNSFTSAIIIEDIADASPTMAKHALLIAASTALLGNNIINSCLTPEILAHLNIRANLSNDPVPTPLPIDMVKDNIHEAITDLMSGNILVGIVIKPGTHYVNYSKYWATEGVMCNKIRAAADELTGGLFSQYMAPNIPMTDVNIETRFCGTYVDDAGNDRPLSEIDIVQLLMTMPTQVTLHDNWILSQSTQDTQLAVALKMAVLDTYCSRGYEITDMQYIVYIRGETLHALSHCLAASGIKLDTNAGGIVPNVNTNWEAHSASHAGFNLNTISMSPLNTGSSAPQRRIIM